MSRLCRGAFHHEGVGGCGGHGGDASCWSLLLPGSLERWQRWDVLGDVCGGLPLGCLLGAGLGLGLGLAVNWGCGVVADLDCRLAFGSNGGWA